MSKARHSGADLPKLASELGVLRAKGRVPADVLVDLAADILVAAGLAHPTARLAADLLVDAQRRGIDSHGLAHLPIYVARLLNGAISTAGEPKIVREGPAVAVIDGVNALGVLVASYAVRKACELASLSGVGVCAVQGSNHFGAAAPLVEGAARQGFVVLAFSNAAATMAPWGGREALLGTNPLAAAFPVERGAPVVVDMATSAVARGRIRKAQVDGEAIPENWALDASGLPTTDATAALAGTVQPLGGAKGYALAVAVELLCTTLSGGRGGFDVRNPHDPTPEPAGTSHLFIAMDPAHFAGADTARRIAATLGERVEHSVSAGQEAPRLPGSRAEQEMKRREREGVPVTAGLLASLQASLHRLEKAHP